MLKRKRKFIGALFASVFSPASLPNLRSWFTDDFTINDDGLGNNNRNWYNDLNSNCNLYPLVAGGVFNPLTLLNGHTVMGNCTGANTEYGTDGNPLSSVNVMQINNASFTGLFLINQTGNANQQSHRQRGANNTDFLFRAIPAGNLQWFVRSDNAQTILLNSVSNFTGAGWFIVAVTYNFATRTARLIESGNIISGTDVLQDNFTFTVGINASYLISANDVNLANWAGGLGEFFYYTDVKSNAEINLLGNYLGQKYALTWTNI